MPKLYSRTIMSALVANGLISATSALSLANFTPRIENLPSRCQAVYTTQIQGCQAGDFTTQGGTCSSQCVNGLVTIMRAVETACAGVDVPETSVIGVFLLGLGVQTLCPGIEVVTLNPSSTAPSRAPQPTVSQRQTTTTTSEEARSTSATTTTSSSSGISVDTSVPTTFATSALPPEESAPPAGPPAPKTSATLQKSNADSGGGSPFDIVATGSSVSRTSLRSTMLAAALGAVAIAFAAL